LVASEAGGSNIFLIEHRYRSGPLDGKSRDPGDRIEVRTVEATEGYHGEEERARGCQIGS
jgi:hypothetical protein